MILPLLRLFLQLSSNVISYLSLSLLQRGNNGNYYSMNHAVSARSFSNVRRFVASEKDKIIQRAPVISSVYLCVYVCVFCCACVCVCVCVSVCLSVIRVEFCGFFWKLASQQLNGLFSVWYCFEVDELQDRYRSVNRSLVVSCQREQIRRVITRFEVKDSGKTAPTNPSIQANTGDLHPKSIRACMLFGLLADVANRS